MYNVRSKPDLIDLILKLCNLWYLHVSNEENQESYQKKTLCEAHQWSMNLIKLGISLRVEYVYKNKWTSFRVYIHVRIFPSICQE